MSVTVRTSSVRFRPVGDQSDILHDISFEIEAGETVALMGPSGCGKSTMIEFISGFARPTSGSIEHRPSLGRIDCGFLTQDSNDIIFPWRRVRDNLRVIGEAGRREGAPGPFSPDDLLSRLDLINEQGDFPAVLSGGQARRLALAMVLSTARKLLLLDEPFTGLDLDLRVRVMDLIHDFKSERVPPPTILFSTHGVEDAVLLSERTIFLDRTDAGVVVRQKTDRFPIGADRPSVLARNPEKRAAYRAQVQQGVEQCILAQP